MPKLTFFYRNNAMPVGEVHEIANAVKDHLYLKFGLIPANDEWAENLKYNRYAEFTNETYDKYFDVIALNSRVTTLMCIFEKHYRCIADGAYIPHNDRLVSAGATAILEYLIQYGELFPANHYVTPKGCGGCLYHISSDGTYFIYKNENLYYLFESC